MGEAQRFLGILVYLGNCRVRSHPRLSVGLRSEKQKRQCHSGRLDLGHSRGDPQPAQRVDHCIQVGCAGEILSFLARDRGHLDDHLHRDLGLQMGRFEDACDEKKQAPVEETEWKPIIMSTFSKPKDWNTCCS